MYLVILANHGWTYIFQCFLYFGIIGGNFIIVNLIVMLTKLAKNIRLNWKTADNANVMIIHFGVFTVQIPTYSNFKYQEKNRIYFHRLILRLPKRRYFVHTHKSCLTIKMFFHKNAQIIYLVKQQFSVLLHQNVIAL